MRSTKSPGGLPYRWCRPVRRGCATATLLLLGLTSTQLVVSGVEAQAQTAASTTAAPVTSSTMDVSQVMAAAERILQAMKDRDANARFALFSDNLKATSSPALVARNLAKQPKLLSWRITSVETGLDTATVHVLMTTVKGSASLLLVINAKGQLAAYKMDNAKAASTAVAEGFVQALTEGKFVLARSFFSLALQREISPRALQHKWLNLQTMVGNYVDTRRVVEAERSSGVRLVLVTMEFTRMSDTLFVILDDRNQIVGLDFPNEPALVKPGS